MCGAPHGGPLAVLRDDRKPVGMLYIAYCGLRIFQYIYYSRMGGGGCKIWGRAVAVRLISLIDAIGRLAGFEVGGRAKLAYHTHTEYTYTCTQVAVASSGRLGGFLRIYSSSGVPLGQVCTTQQRL